MLELERVAVSYGRVAGTQDISFSLGDGQSLALVGSNGAGKSSTLKAVVGLCGYRGSIVWNGQRLRPLDPESTARNGIGFSPEGRQVFRQLTVADNLLSGGYIMGRTRAKERRETIYGYFPRLHERHSQFAGSLSGGEQQMVAIGRALMCRPRLLLLDEPSLGLAPIAIERIGEIISEVQRQEGLSVILAEQNANWSMRVAETTVIVELGRTTLSGPSATLAEDDRVQRAYLGLF